MERILRYFLLISALLVLAACGQHDEYFKQMVQLKEKEMALEPIERETHSKQRNWIEIEISKYDGRCISINDSARSHMERVYGKDDVILIEAIKYTDDEYLVGYKTGPYAPESHVFATSLQLCNDVIQANISK